MNPIRKLIAGDPYRPTRFHTLSGEFMGWNNLGGLWPAAVSWLRHRVTGRFDRQPWMAWKAIDFLENALRPDDCVLEIGSGYSSIWLAKRTSHVWAVEDVPAWAERVRGAAVDQDVQKLELVEGDSFSAFSQQIEERRYDVIIVDGSERRLEMFDVLLNLPSAKLPRMIVYDDTDKPENQPALKRSLEGYRWIRFLGFKPQAVHACETAILVRGGGEESGTRFE